MFCLKEAPRSLRKRLLAVLVGCFVADIICLLIAIVCLVTNYMNAVPNLEQLNVKLTLATDVLVLASIIVYLFMIKFKTLIGLVINASLLIAAIVVRVLVLVLRGSSPEANSEPLWKSGLLLGCAIFQVLLLIFVGAIWRMVPDKKWIKKFDLTTKMTIVEKPKRLSALPNPVLETVVSTNLSVPPQSKTSVEQGSSLALN